MMASLISEVSWRELQPGQVSEVRILTIGTGESTLLFRDPTRVLESANWAPGGGSLLVNSAGTLYRIPLQDPELQAIPSPGIADHNNDHQYSPDGSTIYTSSETTGHIFAMPAEGGIPRRITPERAGPFSHFLQSVSHDGEFLHYTGARRDHGTTTWDLYRIRVDGTGDEQLTAYNTVSVGHEQATDGWRYFHSDLADPGSGTSHLFRIHPKGGLERLTHDDRSNWFPKLSPNEEQLAFISFAPNTGFHPANTHVQLRSLDLHTLRARALVDLYGGQGTLNMNSWSPDGARLAYIAYPHHL